VTTTREEHMIVMDKLILAVSFPFHIAPSVGAGNSQSASTRPKARRDGEGSKDFG
jgi:hypothetical protein